MGDSVLRKYIREILFEFYNNSSVYAAGPNKFPYFDDINKTPSELAAEFEEEFNNSSEETPEEFQENIGLDSSGKKVEKKLNFPNKH